MSAARAIPFTGPGYETCYACDGKPVGFAERWQGGKGERVLACARHRYPSIKTYDACMYCLGPVRAGSLDMDGVFAHRSCYEKDARGESFVPKEPRR